MKIKINGTTNKIKFKKCEGVDFSDTDIILSKIIIHQLENFQKHNGWGMLVDNEDVPEELWDYPEDENYEARYEYVMYKMIEGFKRYVDSNSSSRITDKDSLNESLRLFSKYFERLWI